jgi:hypothetical protein
MGKRFLQDFFLVCEKMREKPLVVSDFYLNLIAHFESGGVKKDFF